MRGPGYICSMGRTLEIVGDTWTFWVVREALAGTTKFAEFRANLGIASDVLTTRLATLVAEGIMTRRRYQEPGQRARESYHLTESGRELCLVLGALQQWGNANLPTPIGATTEFCSAAGEPVSVRFVDSSGELLESGEIQVQRVPLRNSDVF